MTVNTTAQVVRAYYDCWKNGVETFDEEQLRRLLAADLDFEGPIAGRRIGADGFLRGLLGFVKMLRSMRVVQEVPADGEAAVLYDCDMAPDGSTLRFAEFFRVENERIQQIRLVYDPAEFSRLEAAVATADTASRQ